MLKRTVIAGALALGLGACATPQRVAFDPATRDKLVEVQVLAVMPQDEVIVRAPAAGASAALGGGLIGAVIDSKIGETRQNELQATLAPFYSSVDDFNFRQLFSKSLGDTLATEKSVRFGQIEHASQHLLQAQLDDRRKKLTDGRALMVSSTSYTFSPDFARLSVTTSVELRAAGKDEAAFRNTYSYQSAPTGYGGPESLKLWAENNGERYRKAAAESVDQIMKMITLDLAAGATDAVQAPKVSLVKLDMPVNTPVNGPVLVAQQNRVIVRNTDGTLFSLPQNGGQP